MVTKEDIIKEVADKLNLDYDIVDSIYSTTMEQIISEIQTGNFKNIQLIHLGKLIAKERYKKRYGKQIKSDS